jgi:Chs5-Arf1p-binding protein BUD7/BCH1
VAGESASPTTNGVDPSSSQKSISSLEPRPPTPSSPHLPNANEIGLPPNSAEDDSQEGRLVFQSKRLCERWLDNLFMVLYEVYSPLSLIHVVI